MKIIFLTSRFYPDIGGVEKHVYRISKILIKKGHKITVITQSQGKEDYIDGIKIIRINGGEEGRLRKFRIWLSLFKYLSLFETSDIVHCHDVFYWFLPFRFIFPFKRVYTTFHGYEGNNLPTKKAILMHKIAEKLSKGNICVGDYLKKWYGTNPTIVTYGAVNINKTKTTHKLENHVIFIGRLEKETGIMEYLKTMYLLKKKGISFILDVYGDGALKNEAINYSKTNKLNVNLKGFIANVSDLVGQYEYVFTSRYLGTLEAFASRRFVFCMYNNSIKRDCFSMSPFSDFIVLEKNPQELANKVTEFFRSPNRFDEKIDKAYNWVSNQTWENLTNQYLLLWKGYDE